MDESHGSGPHVADAFGGSFDDLSPAQPIPVREARLPAVARRPHRLRPRDRGDQGQRPPDGLHGRGRRSARRSRRSINHDAEAALRVIIDDRMINEVQRKATAMIAAMIATQNPVARDLRYLLTLDHVSVRAGADGRPRGFRGQAGAQAGTLRAAQGLRPAADPGRAASALQVHGIIRALVDVDEEGARRVAALDDEVDDLYHAIFDEVLGLMRDDPANVEPGTRILFASHYLERIGDRVTNIAEDIVFLASGEVEDLNP